jgi:8-oxo-dGTP diphosphatase
VNESAGEHAAAPRSRQQIAVAVVEREGRYLIGLRPEGAPLAGYWEFPGGKVRVGETPEAAAARECLEETGLVVRVLREYPLVDHTYEHAAVCLHFFACEVVEQAVDSLPARFRWVTCAELSDYKFPPANAALLAQLQSHHR